MFFNQLVLCTTTVALTFITAFSVLIDKHSFINDVTRTQSYSGVIHTPKYAARM